MNTQIARTSRIIARLLAALFLFVLWSTLTLAQDHKIPVPNDWEIDPANSAWCATPEGGTAVMYLHGVDRYESSKVVQLVGPDSYETTLEGKVFRVVCSPDGQHVLVQNRLMGADQYTFNAHLLNSQGVILWSHTSTSKIYHFSTTGESIYAHSTIDIGHLGTDFQILDLQGGFVWGMDFSRAMSGLVVLGDGSDVIVSVLESIKRYSHKTGKPNTEVWDLEMTQGTPRIGGIRYLNAGHVVVDHKRGAFTVIRLDGTVRYFYDPVALAAADPEAESPDYAKFRAFGTDNLDKVLLFSGESKALQLDLQTQSLSPVTANADAPPGYVVRRDVMLGKMMVSSAKELRIRPVSLR